MMKTDALDREGAFRRMGDRVEALGGAFRTAGDLGTTDADLAAMASRSSFVHTDTPNLAGAVGRGVLRCMEACAQAHGVPSLAGLRIAVQGCGDIGAAVARSLFRSGARIVVADLDRARAESLADEVDGEVSSPDEVLWLDVDVVAPCAVGDVLDARRVERLRAWAVCGGANNICTDMAAHHALHEGGILFVPDLISSSGAVIEGIGETVMGLDDRSGLIDALRETAAAVLHDAGRDGRPPMVHAIERARRRIDAASE
ncbi:MAG TPA: hypothetical protein ENK57_20500 [Polyangiaceae bacterium]|nr:hypothetical protein [Polyangiaceae bacterium]